LLLFWQDDPLAGFSFEQLRAIETTMFEVLRCVSSHCPERRFRLAATAQLAGPWWDRQHRGEEMTEEFVRERRGLRLRWTTEAD
jgi:hypothetical protein